MKAEVARNSNPSRDLTRGISGFLFWCLPVGLLFAGGAWQQGGVWRVWLWVAAFAIMGTGCVINAARCGRTHCYVTGPVLLLAALWSLLSVPGWVTMQPNFLILAVVIVALLAHLAEIPCGRYAGVGKRVHHG